MLRQKPTMYLVLIASLVCYYLLAYEIPRYDTLPLFTAYGVLFLIYLWIIEKSSNQTVTFWIVVSFCFRACLLISLPQLSDDFYRFIWDGRLWAAGQHPFAALPSEYLNWNITGIGQDLYNHLNSKEYFAIYPPVAQYVFWVAVMISPNSIIGSVIVMRVFILLAEIGSVLLMKHLLERFNLPVKNILFYALNPLIILELTGNLHFEAFVIFFLMLTAFFITRKTVLASASSIGVAICVKLVPLIFLPSFIGRLSLKHLILFFSTVVLTCLLLFLPFFDWQVFHSLQSSVGLYFNKFEFNASLYYLVRELGFWRYGYNIIQTVGWKLGLTTFVLIITFVWIRYRQSRLKQEATTNHVLLQDWMWILSIYFLFTTTLHPWYISTLLALSIFTPYRFPLVWTGFIFLTYAGYTSDSFHEVLWLTTLEYVLVVGYLGYELWARRNTLVLPWSNRNSFQS
jgi:alpha-1,6-mannosyltransferase